MKEQNTSVDFKNTPATPNRTIMKITEEEKEEIKIPHRNF
jgi:hypothetical protein